MTAPDSRPPDRVSVVVGILCAIGLGLVLSRLFTVGMAQSYDTTLYGRSLWGIGHGSGVNPVYGTHWLGIHANWVLVLLAPLSWIFSPAMILVGGQAIAAGLSAFLVLRAARDAEGGTSVLGARVATLWGMALVATPLLINPFFFDARPDLIAVPFLLAGLLRVERSGAWDRRAFVYLACAALVREEFAVIGAGCIVLSPAPKGWDLRRRAAAAVGLLAYFALYWFVVRGHFSAFAADRADQAAGDLFAGAGEGVSEFRVQLVIATVTVGGGLVLRGFRWLPAAIPGLVFVGISTKLAEHALNFHYPMFAAPVLVVAAIAGLRSLSTNPHFLRLVLLCSLIGVSVSAALGAHPAGDRFQSEYFGFDESAQPWQRECHALLDGIPDDAGVAMPAMFGPRFAGRQHVWSIETLHRQLVERDSERNPEAGSVPSTVDWIALDNSRFATLGRVLVNRHSFQLVGIAAGRVALLRRADGDPPPVLSIPGSGAECGELSISWSEMGLGLCDISRDRDGRIRATIIRTSPPRPTHRLPSAIVIEVDGQPTPLNPFYGLVDPTTTPLGVAVPAITQDRVSAPEVRVHLQDISGRNFTGTRIEGGQHGEAQLGVLWRF